MSVPLSETQERRQAKRGRKQQCSAQQLPASAADDHLISARNRTKTGTLIAHRVRQHFFLPNCHPRLVRPCRVNHQRESLYPGDSSLWLSSTELTPSRCNPTLTSKTQGAVWFSGDCIRTLKSIVTCRHART